MFRKIRNSNAAYYLYTGFVLAVGAGSLVFFYFMVTGFNIGVYQENTLVGNVYIGGLEESEAEQKVASRIGAWQSDDAVNFEIGYDGYYYSVERGMFDFSVAASMQGVSNGSQNEMVVEMHEQNRSELIRNLMDEPFMEPFDEDAFDFDAVIDELLGDAASMDTFSRIELHEYASDPEEFYETVAEISMPAVRGSDVSSTYGKLAEHLDGNTLSVQPHTTISVLDTFGGTFGDERRFTSAELNTIGSALQDLLLETRMFIIERHYNPQIDSERYSPYEDEEDTYPFFGRNVRVNRILGYDYQFENNTAFEYDIVFGRDGDELTAKLIGPPFVDTIEVERERIEVDYLSETTDEPSEAREGQPGINILITRTITPIDGREAREQLLVFEYYPALSEIVYEGEPNDNDE